jgi:hypothetical protein
MTLALKLYKNQHYKERNKTELLTPAETGRLQDHGAGVRKQWQEQL